MIEIIAGVWLTSFILSALLVGWNLWSIHRQLDSQSLRTLNGNLAPSGLFWSNTASDFALLNENAMVTDRKKALRNAGLLGMCCFASLPGFLFVLAVVCSLRFLARERKETAVFHSDLAHRENLSRDHVDKLVESLRQII